MDHKAVIKNGKIVKVPANYDRFDIEAEAEGSQMRRAFKAGGPAPKSRSARNRVRRKVA